MLLKILCRKVKYETRKQALQIFTKFLQIFTKCISSTLQIFAISRREHR